MSLRKEFAEYLEIRSRLGIPAPWATTIEEFRRKTLPNKDFIGHPEEIFKIEHRVISGPTSYLPIRIYRPSNKENLPALIYFHGGGWVIGNMDGFEPTVRSLANKIGCVVVQVQYQKAPEHPFPSPFNDCYSTVEWVFENAKELGVDITKIGVGGDSAGGNLAAATALKCRDLRKMNLAFQMLVYPCTGYDPSLPSAVNNSVGFGLTSETMRWFEKQYAQRSEDFSNPYAFPAVSEDFSDLAPAVVVTAQYDPLADDGRLYAEKLEESNVPVIFKEYEGAIHGFNALAGVAPDLAFEVQSFLATGIKKFLETA